jgi:phage terminase large subunit-like protein
VIDFANNVLGQPLDPWEEWLVIHAGELLPDGRPRFRTVLALVARQNGKTHVAKVLALFWIFVESVPLVLGTSTNLDYARESWEKAVTDAEDVPCLAALVPRNGVRRTNGEQTLTTSDRSRYKIAASNRKGGRSLSVDRLILDELREHRSWEAWNASTNAMNARPFGQAIAITNQGDDTSVVLDSLRGDALRYLETGVGDERLGLFEWSAPDGADLEDVEALAQANPNVGRRNDWDSLLGPARRAKANGGEEEAGFRTEVMCQRVRALDAAVDPSKWDASCQPDTMDTLRRRVVLCLDIAPDELHATLTAAAPDDDGRIRLEPVKAWSGADATAQVRAELAAEVKRIKPRILGWLPGGPAASLADWIRTARLPCRVEEIKSDLPAVSMGFAEQVRSDAVRHSGDPLQDAQVKGSSKLRTGDRWTLSRRFGHCDAAYAAAGAVHLARAHPELTVRKVIAVPRHG